jgi:hypothetical protein
VLAFVVLASSSCLPEPSVRAGALAERGRVWERFEMAGHVWAAFENPFDPEQDPRRRRVRGAGRLGDRDARLLHARVRRALVGGHEHLHPASDSHWRVRMTPTIAGTWRWRWVVTTPQGARRRIGRRSRSIAPAPDRHGFLHRSPLDVRYLRWDDGTPWVGVGENPLLVRRPRHVRVRRLDPEARCAGRQLHPALDAELGVRPRVDRARARRLGRVELARRLPRPARPRVAARSRARARRAQRHCGDALDPEPRRVLAHERTRSGRTIRTTPANGGPLATPRGVPDRTPGRRALFERRLRYLVARWGWATNLQAWELWNEADLGRRRDRR